MSWLFFFFSSRRRHTRYWRDWSSDVCSSDLRRGRNGIKTFIKFRGFGNDKKIGIVFPLQSKGDRQFEMGIEKIEYLVDIVPVQLRLIPPQTEEIWYLYDETSYKWIPSVAKTSDLNYIRS